MILEQGLRAQWHPTKNLPLTPETLTFVSKKVWWVGACGHEWETSVFARRKGYNCPYCAGKKILPGYNDLASQNPELAAQWHPTKNLPLTADSISPKSSAKKIWWLGLCGHEWEAKVLHRANGSQCPYCAHRLLLVGFNDLATTHPALAAQWDQSLNEENTPQHVKSWTKDKAWWLCGQGHSWEARISDRTQSGSDCHYCSGYKTFLPGVNDLATLHSSILSEWDYAKNDANPSEIAAASQQVFHWTCGKGHPWKASAYARTSLGRTCPTCAGRTLVQGVNDLASRSPDLVTQWHPTKNRTLKPHEMFKTSGRKVWWLCDCGHEWEAQISNRVNGARCPVCARKAGGVQKSTPTVGVNDLLSQYPEIAAQWSPKNALRPDQVHAGSSFRALWTCGKHEWEVRVGDRKNHLTGCPSCAVHTYSSKAELEVADFLSGLGLTIRKHDRTVLSNRKELDIYVPEKSFAVEFNGVYWHDENHKAQSYHLDKYLAAKAVGVQLVQVWEDDWRDRQDVVKRALAHKLGVSGTTSRVFARATRVVLLDTSVARSFLDQNHVQGFASGSYYVGLEDKVGRLCAVLVLREEGLGVLNIIRYATEGSVVGGFTKLLSYAERVYSPESFLTFADHTISDGGLYEKSGFVVDRVLPPDYMYVVRGVRKHKFGYRLKRFRSDPELLWEDGLSERELAVLNRIPRIWDAGKTRYVKVARSSL